MTRTIGALLVLLAGTAVTAQVPAGFDLTLVDVDGTRKVLARLPPSVYAPRVSPEGTRVAYETRDLKGPDGARLWVADFPAVTDRRPLPVSVGLANWAPMWSPDGDRLAFLAQGDRPDAVYWMRADGIGMPEHLIDARSAEGWNGGGAQLRFITLRGNRDYGVALMDMKSRSVTALVDLPDSAQHSSAVSPDGKWMAYASNETGRYELWLEPLPLTGKRYQITREGGSHPLWHPDGRSLYFDRASQMLQLAVNLADPSGTGEPVALPIKGFAQAEYRRQFDLLSNGRQFLMLFPVPAN